MIDQAKTRSPAARTPGRLLTLVAVPVLCVLGFSLMLTATLGGVRDGYQSVGGRSHATLTAIGKLDYDLADMNGKAAEIMVVGDDPGLPQGRAALYQTYEEDQADADARLAVVGSGLDGAPDATTAFVAVENGLAHYASDMGQAFYLEGLEHDQAPARPSPAALAAFRSGSALMQQVGVSTDLLDEVYKLQHDEETAAGKAYDGRLAVLDRIRTAGIALTVLVVAVLLAAQVRLARKFRRAVNPLMALSTVLALVFGVLLFSALDQARGSYVSQRADETTVYWQDEANAADMKASESRWLLDLAGPAQNAGGGTETEQTLFGDDRAGITASSPAFAAYLADDQHLHAMVSEAPDSTQIAQAAAFDTGQIDQDLAKYVSDVNWSISINSDIAAEAGARGANGLLPWLWLPPVWAVLMFLSICGGVWPRLREYQPD